MDVEYWVDEGAGWLWLVGSMSGYEFGWGTGWMKVLNRYGILGG